jgi:sugar/nucleoside kinase (ribokinase family)
VVRAAEKILEVGLKFVIIKKGEHGSFLLHRQGAAALPAYPTRQVIDPTGAGDSFAGGMMGFLATAEQVENNLSIQSLRTAMAYGTVVASFNIESFSLHRLMQIQRRDLEDRFNEFRTMIRIGDGRRL